MWEFLGMLFVVLFTFFVGISLGYECGIKKRKESEFGFMTIDERPERKVKKDDLKIIKWEEYSYVIWRCYPQ